MNDEDKKRFFFAGWWLLGLTGCQDYVQTDNIVQAQRQDELEMKVDTLDLQRRQGWSVGAEENLELDDAVKEDAGGGQRWRELLQVLPQALAPSQPSLLPYYVPTLFQSLVGSSSQSLRDLITPIYNADMQIAFEKGKSVLALFQQADWPTDTAIVVDLPGPDAMALAASLAERFEPVYDFGNWPHPLGVVPSHRTLAAALYFAPALEASREQRALLPSPSPPVFVLDADRLSPYTDANEEFDNRYLARIPTVENLQALGIKHLVYINAAADQPELDDLNEAFVELAQGGIDVRMLSLTDFDRSDERLDEGEDPLLSWSFAGGGTYWWYYGGTPFNHCHFWDHYGFHHRRGSAASAPPPPNAFGMRIPKSAVYRPLHRATIYSGAQVRVPSGSTAYRPAGFASVLVHTSRVSGHLTGMQAGRSGSFGRFHGSASA